jgi:hypothetical protein
LLERIGQNDARERHGTSEGLGVITSPMSVEKKIKPSRKTIEQKEMPKTRGFSCGVERIY